MSHPLAAMLSFAILMPAAFTLLAGAQQNETDLGYEMRMARLAAPPVVQRPSASP